MAPGDPAIRKYLYVGVENARFAPVDFDPEEGLYRSTKSGVLHGMGLKSARATSPEVSQ